MIREILIKPVLNGFICTVGCQLVVFQSASEMVREIEAYYKNPEVVEKAFMAKAVNKMSDGPYVDERPRVGDGRLSEACDTVCETRNPTPIRESVGNARSK